MSWQGLIEWIDTRIKSPWIVEKPLDGCAEGWSTLKARGTACLARRMEATRVKEPKTVARVADDFAPSVTVMSHVQSYNRSRICISQNQWHIVEPLETSDIFWSILSAHGEMQANGKSKLTQTLSVAIEPSASYVKNRQNVSETMYPNICVWHSKAPLGKMVSLKVTCYTGYGLQYKTSPSAQACFDQSNKAPNPLAPRLTDFIDASSRYQ
uniref:BCAS3 domain-containing protein n=1 Tax=Panagrellus redivivus TaxID=6233 RepID=A0A7E4UQ15_PANRE